MSVDRTALFVRVPTSLAERLDERARSTGRSKQDVVTELLTGERDAATDGSETSDVLDVEEVATFLRVGIDDVMTRVAEGDFPARRFGTTWRFSRSAIRSWLAGNDPVAVRPTGFGAPTG